MTKLQGCREFVIPSNARNLLFSEKAKAVRIADGLFTLECLILDGADRGKGIRCRGC